MNQLVFHPRYVLQAATNPDLAELRRIILERGREFGEASFEFGDGPARTSLVALFDDVHGYYLKYFEFPNGRIREWLSLGDPNRLTEVITPDDWEASVGLFIDPEKAWCAIEDFCFSGQRSSRIEWIRPEDVPDGGNW